MPDAYRNYLVRETAISAAINGALTAAFFFAVFHGQATPMVWGPRGLVADCLPQGFMVGLMSVVPATLLTRKRAADGRIAGPVDLAAPRAGFAVRALGSALAGLAALTLAAAGLALATRAQALAFAPALSLKLVASILISCGLTPPAILAALSPKAGSR